MRKMILPGALVFTLLCSGCVRLPLGDELLSADVQYEKAREAARKGDLGHAALYLRRASLLDPSSETYRAALKAVRESAGLSEMLFEPSPIERWLVRPFSSMPLNRKTVVGIAFLAAASLLFTLFFLRKNLFKKRPPLSEKTVWISAFVLAVIGSFWLLLSALNARSVFSYEAAVFLKETALTETPLIGSKETETVPAAMDAVILREENGRLLVRTVEGTEGWTTREAVARLWEKP